jgi:hypothetical protein
MTDDRVADLLRYDESGAGAVIGGVIDMHDERRGRPTSSGPRHPLKLFRSVQSRRSRQHRCRRVAVVPSGRQGFATLAPASGEDRTTRAGPHPQPEAVHLGAPAVVRLEGALAHGSYLQSYCVGDRRSITCWSSNRRRNINT